MIIPRRITTSRRKPGYEILELDSNTDSPVADKYARVLQ